MEYDLVVRAVSDKIKASETEAPEETKHLTQALKQVFVAEVGDLPLIVDLKSSVRVGAVDVKWIVESQRWSARRNHMWYEGEELADLLIRQLPPETILPPPATFFRGTRSRILERLGGVGQAFSDYSELLVCLLDVAVCARHLRKLLTAEEAVEEGRFQPGAKILKPVKKLQGLKGTAPPATRAVRAPMEDPNDMNEAIERLDEALRRLDAHARSMNL